MTEKRSAKNYGAPILWGVTIILALSILGAAVYISRQNTQRSDGSVATSTPQQPKTSPSPNITSTSTSTPTNTPPVEGRSGTTTQSGSKGPQVVRGKNGQPELYLKNLPGIITLSAPALKDRDKIPLTHTCYQDNSSPTLTWDQAPRSTKSFVVFLHKREEDGNFVKWWLFNIPATQKSLRKNLPKQEVLEGNIIQGVNDHGNTGYVGPCDPKGKHKYFLRILALDTMLPPHVRNNKIEFLKAVNGHILDASDLEFVHFFRM